MSHRPTSFSGPSPFGLWISPRMENPQALWGNCVSVWPLSHYKRASLYLNETSCVSDCACCLLCCHWAPLRRARHHLLCYLPSNIYTGCQAPCCTFSRLSNHFPGLPIKLQQLIWSHCLHGGEVLLALVLVRTAVGPRAELSMYLELGGSLELLPETSAAAPSSVLAQAQQKPGALAALQCLASVRCEASS